MFVSGHRALWKWTAGDAVQQLLGSVWSGPVLPRYRPHSPQRTLESQQTAQDPWSHTTPGRPSDCDQLLPSCDRQSSHLRGPAPAPAPKRAGPVREAGSRRQIAHAGARSTQIAPLSRLEHMGSARAP